MVYLYKMADEIEIKQEQNKVVHHEESVEKRNTEKTLRIFAPIIIIVGIIALIWIKAVNPLFPLLYVILIGGFIILVGGMMFFAFTIYRKFQENPDKDKEYQGRLPKPASLGSLREIAQDALTNEHFLNHCTGCIKEQYFNVGKFNERIYCYTTTPLYHQHPNGDFINNKIHILINTHFPDDHRNILIDASPSEFTKAVYNLANYKSEVPEEEIQSRRTFNPVTQAYEEIEKKTTKKEAEKPKEQKEDLE